ncbi:MAG TPA: hypothetical protein VN408_33755, partial [Actinoplanes sp.]|nr:hypothetical protein [Actinoplanes sp.]
TVQNVLFTLGGLLLLVAASVFTAVAWAQVGVTGRALLLAAATAAVLAVPPFAARRGLRSAAETLAIVGLLMILLDGYAAWAVDLLLIRDLDRFGYVAGVLATTAVISVGYAKATGLRGPRISALLLAQPVFPLLAAAADAELTGWSLAFLGTLILNIAVLQLPGYRPAGPDSPPVTAPPTVPGPPAAGPAGGWTSVPWQPGHPGHQPAGTVTVRGVMRGIAVAWGAVSAGIAGLFALADLFSADGPGATAAAGAVLVLVPIALVGWAVLARLVEAQRVTSALLLVATAVAGFRWILEIRVGAENSGWQLTRLAVVALVVAAVAALLRPRPAAPAGATVSGEPVVTSADEPDAPVDEPVSSIDGDGEGSPQAADPHDRVRPPHRSLLESVRRVTGNGPWAGALIAGAVPASGVAVALGLAITRGVEAARPVLAAPSGSAVGGPDVDSLVALIVTVVAYALLVPRRVHADLALSAVAAAGLLIPAVFGLLWWSGAVAGLLVGAVALVRAAGSRSLAEALYPVAASVVLLSYAVLIGSGRPGVVAGVLGTIVVLGVGTALAVRTRLRGPDVGAGALVVGLAAIGPAVWLGLLAADATVTAQVRAALLVAVLLCLVAHAVARILPEYGPHALGVTLVVVTATPLWAAPGTDPVSLHTAAALLLVAALLPIRIGRQAVLAAAAIPGLALLGLTFTDIAVVVFEPWTATTGVWSGIAPVQSAVAWPSVVALALAGVATTAGVLAAGPATGVPAGRSLKSAAPAAPFVALLIPLTLAAAGAPWPVVPIAALVCGLLGLVAAALVRRRRIVHDLTAVLGGVLAAAGVAGSLAGYGPTIVAFTLLVVAGAVVGWAAPAELVRIAGWTAGSMAVVVLAYTVGNALDLGKATPLTVLAGGALVVALEWVLRARRPGEATAPFVVAHAAALIALVISDSVGWAAHACRLWALVLVVRTLRPGESGRVRYRYGLAASAVTLLSWWLLLVDRDVETAEAYTLPAALLALGAGWVARRGRPELPSWSAYGPALTTAFLPSLAVIAYSASDDPQYLRRLLLGVGSLVVLLLGARARLQAPVVVGGGVLVFVALHELIQFWDLVPRWVPLAVGGLLLVGIATTIEQRRRDLARLKGAITRMS